MQILRFRQPVTVFNQSRWEKEQCWTIAPINCHSYCVTQQRLNWPEPAAIMHFKNRTEAGRQLAALLTKYFPAQDLLVLALPRGGVPVACEVARTLHAPLDVFLVRKLGVPGQEELALGAIASGGVRFLNSEVIEQFNISTEAIEKTVAREKEELERRERAYRDRHSAPDPRGRQVILVDDGLATGSTMRAAVAALRQRQPARIIVAVPVAARSTADEFKLEVDDFVCVHTPVNFYAVGQWYQDFAQTTDEEVRQLLRRAAQERST